MSEIEKVTVNREYKDRLLNFIFGSEENRRWTLSLYNAINNMPEEFLLKPFLMIHRSEVNEMLLTEYNEAEVMELFKEDGRREGREEERKDLIPVIEEKDKQLSEQAEIIQKYKEKYGDL